MAVGMVFCDGQDGARPAQTGLVPSCQPGFFRRSRTRTMAFTTSPVPMDLASLRLRALQRDMSAAATDAAATVFTAAPVMEALSRHLEAAHSKEQPASSAAAKSGAALLNDQVRDSLELRLRTEDEERQHLAQRILAAQRTCTAAVSFQQGAAEMPRVGLAGGATAVRIGPRWLGSLARAAMCSGGSCYDR